MTLLTIERLRRSLGSVFLGSLLVLVIYALWSAAEDLSGGRAATNSRYLQEPMTHVLIVFAGLVPILAVMWFLYLFGGVVMSPGKVGQIIRFCYLTSGVMVIGSVLPFFAFPLAPGLQQLMIASPVGVMPGCKIQTAQTPGAREVACGEQSDQWVVNIGGTVERPALSASDAVATGSAGADRRGWAAVRIHGGLVVPLYFVIVALMGAAISMTRGVPRCQQRLIPGQPDSTTPEEAREYLVLQIMQMLSAPLIATVAYHSIEPDSPKASVVLGFACGFASETILLLISSAMRRIGPESSQSEIATPVLSENSIGAVRDRPPTPGEAARRAAVEDQPAEGVQPGRKDAPSQVHG
jgi:hypothetical protein